MKTIGNHSARASFQAIADYNFVEVNYTGVLAFTSLAYLQKIVLAETLDIPALVLRMDRALVAMSCVPVSERRAYGPAGAIVVRPDQFDLGSDYAQKMAAIGVRRVVFLESQLCLAYEWAEQRAQRRVPPRF